MLATLLPQCVADIIALYQLCNCSRPCMGGWNQSSLEVSIVPCILVLMRRTWAPVLRKQCFDSERRGPQVLPNYICDCQVVFIFPWNICKITSVTGGQGWENMPTLPCSEHGQFCCLDSRPWICCATGRILPLEQGWANRAIGPV